MKNKISKYYYKYIFIIIIACSALSLKAGDIQVKTKSADAKLTVKENTYSNFKFSNSFDHLKYWSVKTDKDLFTELSIPDYGYSNKIGDPKLPVSRKFIEIPFGSTPVVKVISYSMTEYNLSDYGVKYKLMPAQPPVSKGLNNKAPKFQYNKATYSTNQFNSDELVSVDVIGIMRNVRLARLDIAPVRYNPVTNTIQVFNDIEVEITFQGADIAGTAKLKKEKYSPYFESMFNNQLINYKRTFDVRDTVTKYPVKYVIVSDSVFKSALQPFIQWKTKKGFTVVEAYTDDSLVGTTTTSIKNYLEGLYNAGTASNPAPSFVLFVGDVAQIPAFAGTGNGGGHVTDLYYCEYTGDYIPEIYYGRFSASTVADLQPQIDKTLEYEQYLMPDPAFLDSVVMIAGVDDGSQADGGNSELYGNGQINYGTSNYFNLAHGLNSDTYLWPTSNSSTASSSIIADISKGVGFANYTAHGSPDGWYNPSFSVSDVAGLQNNHKYPLMVGNCCQTNTFNNSVCFGEALLRASGKGAVGYIGASNYSYWDEDYWFATGYRTVVENPTYSATSLGAYDRTFHDHSEKFGDWFTTMDQMIFAGNLAVTQSGSSLMQYYWEIYCLMGDPSLMIYFGVPPALTATYNSLLPIGTNSFTVNTEPYAYVAVSMSGVLYGAALADSSGVAIVPLNPITIPGTASVVATKQNRSPFIDSVYVANPSGPYVVYNSELIHDISGNNNGQADYSEKITLDVNLKNLGLSLAHNVLAKLRTNDAFVTITDSTQSWGNIMSDSSSTQNNAYAFTVADYVPDKHPAHFTLAITDSIGNSWSGAFNVVLNSPALSIGSITINDASGNGNGKLDPGETADIIISSKNIGTSDALNTISNLVYDSGSVTINNVSVNLGTLSANTGAANATFNVTVSPSAVIGSIASFTNTLKSGLYSVQKPINLLIGLVDEDWETVTFTKFPWAQGAYPWTITNAAPFQGIYSARSGTITDSQSSDLSITFNVLFNDTISFYRKVSSESNYDFFNFSIDGVLKDTASGVGGGWVRVAVPVVTGFHTFEWSYAKDASNSAGSDCAWIDYIIFPPMTFKGVSVPEISSNNSSLNCFPNPFNQSTLINYSLEKTSNVTMKIYNIVGQEIATLVSEKNKQPGKYSVLFDAEKYRSGIYQCVLTTNNNTFVQKLVITR